MISQVSFSLRPDERDFFRFLPFWTRSSVLLSVLFFLSFSSVLLSDRSDESVNQS